MEFHFSPLNWFHLFNQFQLKNLVYIGLFWIVGILSVSSMSCVYGCHRLLSKIRHPPSFHGLSFAKLITIPSMIGCGLGSIPYIICALSVFSWLGNFNESRYTSSVVLNNLSTSSFEHLNGSWLDTRTLDTERIKCFRVGRLGVALLFLGLYSTALISSIIIPTHKWKKSSSKRKNSLIQDVLRNKSEALFEKLSIRWERSHLVFSSFCVEWFLLCVWEFSYSTQFAGMFRS